MAGNGSRPSSYALSFGLKVHSRTGLTEVTWHVFEYYSRQENATQLVMSADGEADSDLPQHWSHEEFEIAMAALAHHMERSTPFSPWRSLAVEH